jgi:hypothetical protein
MAVASVRAQSQRSGESKVVQFHEETATHRGNSPYELPGPDGISANSR